MNDREADDVRTQLAPHAPQLPLTLLPITASIPRARRFVSEALPDTCCAEEITLLVSELASNAVRHAGTPFTVSLGCDGQVVRVEVRDGSSAFPLPRVPPLEAVTGRGLMIVEAIATQWGTEPTPSGKVVWFELACRSSRRDGDGDGDGAGSEDGDGAAGAPRP